jgi:hypothetical protein
LYQFPAFFARPPDDNLDLVIQRTAVTKLKDRAHSTRSWIGGTVDKPLNPGVNESAGAHGAGLDRRKERGSREPVVADGCRRFSKRDNLGVCRRISPRDRLIVTAACNLAVDDHNCTYRNLTGITRGSGSASASDIKTRRTQTESYRSDRWLSNNAPS